MLLMIKQKGPWVIKRRLVYVCVRVCDPGGGGFSEQGYRRRRVVNRQENVEPFRHPCQNSEPPFRSVALWQNLNRVRRTHFWKGASNRGPLSNWSVPTNSGRLYSPHSIKGAPSRSPLRMGQPSRDKHQRPLRASHKVIKLCCGCPP